MISNPNTYNLMSILFTEWREKEKFLLIKWRDSGDLKGKFWRDFICSIFQFQVNYH